MTDLELAKLCAESYDVSAKWDHVWDVSGTYVTHRKISDLDVVIFRGSITAEDWIHDVEAFPFWDSRIGFVHQGFMVGMDEALAAVLANCSPRIVVSGHSLGGARARILAALLAYAGRPVLQCCVFGSPRPAFSNLARVLQKSKTPLKSYRNRNDPVPLVPYMGGLYEHPDPWAPVSCAPAGDDLSPLRDHHVALYVSALGALPVTPSATPAPATA